MRHHLFFFYVYEFPGASALMLCFSLTVIRILSLRERKEMDYLNYFLWILVSCAFFKMCSWITISSHANLPPGPVSLPIIGNLFQLGKKPHKSLTRLAEIYGPLMSLKLGSITAVVISSSTIAKEIFQKHDQSISSRIVLDAVKVCDHHNTSMIWLPVSPQWKNLRKLANSLIFAPQKLDSDQHLRQQKLNDLICHVRRSASSGSVVDIGQVAYTTALNLLSNTFFSVDLAGFSSDFDSTFEAAIRGVMTEVSKPNFSDYFPILKFLDLQGYRRRMKNHFVILHGIFDKIIDQKLLLSQSAETESSTSRDVLDMILDPCTDGIKLQRREIRAILMDFFSAGIDTASSTIEWAMAELIRNPSKMLKAQQELSNIIGKDRPIEEKNIIRLPYLQAIVKETLRLHPPAPLLVPHKAEIDFKFHDFVIPKGTQVLVNSWAISRDPNTWTEPTSFQPERFLASKIDYKGQDFEFIPFGSGRRICPGLPLAHRMVHSMLGSLLQSFDWKLENGLNPRDLDMEDEFGITLVKANRLQAIPVIRS
ncbi:geraniol 8-hydroxylase-like [Papaver somniferum]|nr:geraniol 8-hydroxylase-like [Papaver somniferum]